MNNFENNIDKMVSKILAEEIEKKSKQISEQLEEEALARTMLDKLKLIGGDKGGMYMFDRDLENATIQATMATNQGA